MRPAAVLIISALLAGNDAAEQVKGESWRFNARERTASGLRELEKGNADAAAERFEMAERLAHGSPVTIFNSATAQLLAAREGAAERLTEAVALAPHELLPAANFNLGNARLAEGEPAAAIEAYKQTLRLDPANAAAKFNLEVAQRMLEQQEQQQQQQQGSSGGEEEQEQVSPESEDEDRSEHQQQQPGEPPREEPQEPAPDPEASPAPQPDSRDQDSEQQSPLPSFDDQQDMTAEQAAAILEAVENLERDQRRQQALERAKKRARAGKDW